MRYHPLGKRMRQNRDASERTLMVSIKLSIAAALLAATAVPVAAQDGGACPTMRWTTLGTAGGPVPTLDRSEPANLLDIGARAILVDTGDGTADALGQLGRGPGEVDTILISHLHWDHVGGLSAVLGLRWMNNYTSPIAVYGPPGIREVVDGIVQSLRPQERVGFGIGAKTADPAANITVVEIPDETRIDLGGGLSLRAVRNTHFDHPLEHVGTVSLSYRFDFAGRSITYSGDTGPSEALTTLADGSDMLVTEIMSLDPLLDAIQRMRPDMTPEIRDNMSRHLATHHMNAEQVGAMAKAAQVRRVVLTHFVVPPTPLRESETYLRDGVRRSYAGTLDLARDLSSFDLGCE